MLVQPLGHNTIRPIVTATQGRATPKSHLIEEDLRVASTTPTRRQGRRLQEGTGGLITVKDTTDSRPFIRYPHRSSKRMIKSRMIFFVTSRCPTRQPIE